MVTSNKRFGKSNWEEEVKTGNPNGQKTKDVYTRLEPGKNIVRLITTPFQYYSHKYKEEGDSGFGDRVMCSMPAHKSCPLCAKGDKPKRRWFVGIINRGTQRVEILDISVSVYKHIQELNREEMWGDPQGYDLNIKVDRDGGATGYYTVMPLGKTPLTAADVEFKKTINEEELARKCTPPSPQSVLDRVNFFRTKRGQPALVVDLEALAAKAASGTATAQIEMASDSEVDQFDFPAANVS